MPKDITQASEKKDCKRNERLASNTNPNFNREEWMDPKGLAVMKNFFKEFNKGVKCYEPDSE